MLDQDNQATRPTNVWKNGEQVKPELLGAAVAAEVDPEEHDGRQGTDRLLLSLRPVFHSSCPTCPFPNTPRFRACLRHPEDHSMKPSDPAAH